MSGLGVCFGGRWRSLTDLEADRIRGIRELPIFLMLATRSGLMVVFSQVEKRGKQMV